MKKATEPILTITCIVMTVTHASDILIPDVSVAALHQVTVRQVSMEASTHKVHLLPAQVSTSLSAYLLHSLGVVV